MSGQLPDCSGWSISCHPSCVEPLRPAWPSCRQNFAGERSCTNLTMRRHASRCASFHSPVQPGVMRACAETQVISVYTRPAPPMARCP